MIYSTIWNRKLLCCLAFPAAPMIPMTCFVYFFVHVLLFAVFRAPYRVFFLRFLVHHIALFSAILRAPKIRTNVTEHSKITNHIYNVVTLYASFLPEWVGGQQKNTFQEILGRNCRFLIDPVPPEQIDVTIRRHCRDFCNAVAVGKEYSIWLVISNMLFSRSFFFKKHLIPKKNRISTVPFLFHP